MTPFFSHMLALSVPMKTQAPESFADVYTNYEKGQNQSLFSNFPTAFFGGRGRGSHLNKYNTQYQKVPNSELIEPTPAFCTHQLLTAYLNRFYLLASLTSDIQPIPQKPKTISRLGEGAEGGHNKSHFYICTLEPREAPRSASPQFYHGLLLPTMHSMKAQTCSCMLDIHNRVFLRSRKSVCIKDLNSLLYKNKQAPKPVYTFTLCQVLHSKMFQADSNKSRKGVRVLHMGNYNSRYRLSSQEGKCYIKRERQMLSYFETFEARVENAIKKPGF